jgi:flagellar hook protein FlgE
VLRLTSTNNPNNVLALDYDTTSVAGINANPAALQAGLTTLLGSATFGTTPMVVVFDSDGAPLSFDGAALPPTIAIDWSDSLTNASSNSITLSMGAVGDLGGVICKAGPYNLTFSSQNGVKFGNFSGVEIDRDGIVAANFDNGQSLKIFKIPLANFANPNKMASRSGDVFMQTDASGTYLLKSAGAGGIGNVSSKTVESSTVELATEFSNMIIAQRAYSANVKVISTADEMLASLDRVR